MVVSWQSCMLQVSFMFVGNTQISGFNRKCINVCWLESVDDSTHSRCNGRLYLHYAKGVSIDNEIAGWNMNLNWNSHNPKLTELFDYRWLPWRSMEEPPTRCVKHFHHNCHPSSRWDSMRSASNLLVGAPANGVAFTVKQSEFWKVDIFGYTGAAIHQNTHNTLICWIIRK